VPTTVQDIVGAAPVLYHMAAPGSWPSIQQHGLLSTEALLDLWGIKGKERADLLTSRRPRERVIEHEKYGKATIRDQKPMSDGQLTRCLQGGLTAKDWYRILNGKTFFWLTKDRLRTLMGCYSGHPNLVLTVDTAELLKRHSRRVMLSPMNSGCTRPMPHPRGPNTFQTLAEYNFDLNRRKKGGRAKAIVEITVKYDIPDIEEFTLDAREIILTEEGCFHATRILKNGKGFEL
jgi:hypothetical protein